MMDKCGSAQQFKNGTARVSLSWAVLLLDGRVSWAGSLPHSAAGRCQGLRLRPPPPPCSPQPWAGQDQSCH